MRSQQTLTTTHSVETPSGRISYASAGSGPVALFVHGVVLNKHLWRHQLAGLSDIRRCIAVDLLAHGDTEISPDQDVSVTANAKMLKEVLDALKIDQVDLVGNDSGGGIAQIFAALNPERVRTLTLTNCDTHDNWPPEAFKPTLAAAAAGQLAPALRSMLADVGFARSGGFGNAYARPEALTWALTRILTWPAGDRAALVAAVAAACARLAAGNGPYAAACAGGCALLQSSSSSTKSLRVARGRSIAACVEMTVSAPTFSFVSAAMKSMRRPSPIRFPSSFST